MGGTSAQLSHDTGGSATTGASSALTSSEPAVTSGPAGTASAASASRSTTAPESGDATRTDTTGQNAETTSAGLNTGTAGVIEALREYLEEAPETRPDWATLDFALDPLSKQQAQEAKELLWQDHVATIRATRRAEHEAKVITLDGKSMRYDYTVFGEAPDTGRSLVLSLHGGGEADASVNDEQWENQKQLYTLEEGIYLSPRAPTNTWNLWHEAHIDPMFERLIENFVAIEGVDPNRVYVMGYSAGGDGVYQLGPRMADHWAAASAMAGHPNEAKPFSLRNTPFTIHVGGNDTAFDRNLVAVQWRDQLETLRGMDPEGYEHVVEVHAGKGHWMDLEDAVAVPWMLQFTRNPIPSRLVWYQDDILHQRFHWLKALDPVKETTVHAEFDGSVVQLRSDDVARVAVRLRDEMFDLDQAVTITANGESVFEGVVTRTISTLYQTLVERGDPTLMFSAETVVQF